MRTDQDYLMEIAGRLGCHRGLILETITELQEDLDEQETIIRTVKDLVL